MSLCFRSRSDWCDDTDFQQTGWICVIQTSRRLKKSRGWVPCNPCNPCNPCLKKRTRRITKKKTSFCALLNVVFLITIQRYNILQAYCPPMSANVRQCPPTFVIVCKCGSCLLCLHFYQQSNVTTCLSALRTLITLSKFSKFFDSLSTNIKFTK